MSKTVAIIGAGMAGLGAARALTEAGKQVVLYEKSRAVGGRVATRRVEGCIFDHGAQNLKPGDSELSAVMLNDLSTADLVRIEAPTCLYTDDGQIWPPDPEREAEPKYAYRHGMTVLPKLLAQKLPSDLTTIRYETRIARLEEGEDGVLLRDETGEVVGNADLVIVTAPAPQAADLLGESAVRMRSTNETLDRVRALRNVEYNACLSVMLGYASSDFVAPAYALLAENRANSLLWLAFEHLKAPERAPDGQTLLIAQLGPRISKYCYAEEDALIAGRTLNELRPLFGETFEQPLWWQVKRWKYSQPNGMVNFFEVNYPEMASSVLVCGDGLRPENGRIHQAYAGGLEAAEFALNLLER